MLKLLRNVNLIPPKPATDLWHVGIAHCPISAVLDPKTLATSPITWLPEPGAFRFIADPFGLHHDNQFTVFVEALDYRIKRGEIHYYTYDAAWQLIGQGVALKAPFHLSYPTIIRDGGHIYMLPEAHKSGKLTLYRAARFPDQWEPVADLLTIPAIDASVVYYENRWWMFYALPGANHRALRELHVAYADALIGPWVQHTANPVREALDSARPGGMPFMHEAALYLPVQNCVNDYGTAIHILRVETLTIDTFVATPIRQCTPEGIHPNYPDGLHTLSGDRGSTLIDVKRINHSWQRTWINLQRRINRCLPTRR
jgi:hypothetical protein